MKTFKLFSTVLMGLLVITSCDKDEMGPVANSNPNSPSITAPQAGQSYTLAEEQANDTLLTLEWTKPDYGFSSAPSFTVQMAQPEQDFSDPITLGTVNRTSFSVTVGDMNNQMLSAGLQPETESSLDFRVISSVSDSMGQQVSESLSLLFTPYRVEVNYPKIYVPGSYQGASGYESDWSPDVAPALVSVNSDDKYEGYVYMANTDNEFKFTNEPNWDNGDYGDNDADGSLDPGGANIKAAEAGYYKFNVDLNSLNYSMLNTTWGIIGSATPNGWDSGQDMSYNPETKVWTINVQLTAGEMKFRANDAWDLDYGDNDADGTLDQGGDNIAVDEAGDYIVTLNLSEVPYTFSLSKN